MTINYEEQIEVCEQQAAMAQQRVDNATTHFAREHAKLDVEYWKLEVRAIERDRETASLIHAY